MQLNSGATGPSTVPLVMAARDGRLIEIDDVAAARAWVRQPAPRPPAAFEALDLRECEGFESGRFDGCLFLSCVLTPTQAGYLTTTGATVLRDSPHRPFTAHRAALYTPDELFAGFDPSSGYRSTFDARVHDHYVATGRQHPARLDESLARRLHDHSITVALREALVGARPVAIMGGHGLERADPGYARVARIARTLTRDGFLMLSGGGPGAMEATHLGAWMAHFDDDELDAAIAVLAPRPDGAAPGLEYADVDWLHRALAVRHRWSVPTPTYHSIGIPTWMYGHEPPAAFATKVAKYFANSVREEGLLAVATYGVIFSPGSAGTVQEIFQDATQNHYESFGPPSPMVLLGVEHWTERLPVVPLVRALADGRAYADLVLLTDDEHATVAAIRAHTRPALE
jgi:predicted Rossmann-fold nucleotide-binding protein